VDFCGLGAGWLNRLRVFVAQAFEGGGERAFLAANSLYFGDEGVGIQFGRRLKLETHFFDTVIHATPAQERREIICPRPRQIAAFAAMAGFL
jgi:hypothetical protein